MFENILGQEAVLQLAEDIRRDVLAPSMLFRGPRASGKGTAALELSRILSCEKADPHRAWACSCPACRRHRLLYHPDLLALGSRPFSAEIAAAAAAFTAGPWDQAVKTFFIRAIRKLILRFSPVLWEDESKAGKLAPALTALEEDLDEIIARQEEGEANSTKSLKWAEKISKSISKNALNLEAEGVTDLIPVAQIRRAAYWSRLAPQGKRKLLLIENADRMQDASRNALLKILEEPPGDVVIVLTTAHGDALLPTILSRLRPYRFYPRSAEVEKEVLRRVFRSDKAREKAKTAGMDEPVSITGYLNSFLPVSGEALYPLAAFFVASAAYRGARSLFSAGLSALPGELEALGQYAAGIAEKAGLERHAKDTGSCVAAVLKGAEDFKTPGLFAQFVEALLGVISGGLRGAPPSPGGAAFADIWRQAAGEAVLATGTYNQTPALVLDRLCTELTRRTAALYRGPPALL
ncbi:MAG: DNA polymerase III [Treponema sp.]|jgi:DNA polymerase-3 subunit gamma/tau|nr:DNA polymerase III [Treponema sp.]